MNNPKKIMIAFVMVAIVIGGTLACRTNTVTISIGQGMNNAKADGEHLEDGAPVVEATPAPAPTATPEMAATPNPEEHLEDGLPAITEATPAPAPTAEPVAIPPIEPTIQEGIPVPTATPEMAATPEPELAKSEALPVVTTSTSQYDGQLVVDQPVAQPAPIAPATSNPVATPVAPTPVPAGKGETRHERQLRQLRKQLAAARSQDERTIVKKQLDEVEAQAQPVAEPAPIAPATSNPVATPVAPTPVPAGTIAPSPQGTSIPTLAAPATGPAPVTAGGDKMLIPVWLLAVVATALVVGVLMYFVGRAARQPVDPAIDDLKEVAGVLEEAEKFAQGSVYRRRDGSTSFNLKFKKP